MGRNATLGHSLLQRAAIREVSSSDFTKMPWHNLKVILGFILNLFQELISVAIFIILSGFETLTG
jgi:hypothetical protein